MGILGKDAHTASSGTTGAPWPKLLEERKGYVSLYIPIQVTMKRSRDKNLKQNLEGRAEAGAMQEGRFSHERLVACSACLLTGSRTTAGTAHRDLGFLPSIKTTHHRLTHRPVWWGHFLI